MLIPPLISQQTAVKVARRLEGIAGIVGTVADEASWVVVQQGDENH